MSAAGALLLAGRRFEQSFRQISIAVHGSPHYDRLFDQLVEKNMFIEGTRNEKESPDHVEATCALLTAHPQLGPSGGFTNPRLRAWQQNPPT